MLVFDTIKMHSGFRFKDVSEEIISHLELSLYQVRHT